MNVSRYFCNGRKIMATLETLRFDNLALKKLPIDPEEKNYVRGVAGACFSKVSPTPVKDPELIVYSKNAMELLDLPESELKRKDFAEYFSGNKLLPGSETAAHCYCGHQFGHFSGQLGDGAAMYLGEVINKKGERWEIQLKGAGLTPYSRTADGRKVMRSSIREFLCSEAMHFVGIPTTRAGSCITSNTEVVRDVFYDGHPIKEKCTIVLRIAQTFLRFGSFEIFKTIDPITGRCGPSVGRHDILHSMLDYSIETFYPEIHAAHINRPNEEKYAAFFKEVILRTAQLVALWQCYGFCHGVLNTDNMSIVGVTIDYGPFGFLDMYNPDHICNGSDDGGRYSFRKQPEICLWNLKKLAEAIQKALPLSISLPLLNLFDTEFKSYYLKKMRLKLGLTKKELSSDNELIENLFETMENTCADFTNTFRCLNLLELPTSSNHKQSFQTLVQKLVDQCCYPLDVYIKTLKNGMESRNVQMLLMLAQASPQFAEQIGTHDLNRIMTRLNKADELAKLSSEDKKKKDKELWTNWVKRYVKRLSSETEDIAKNLESLKSYQKQRLTLMNENNPKFILRNYIAQNAIAKAENGDFSEVQQVLKLLENPYEETSVLHETSEQGASCSNQKKFIDTLDLPPDWAFRLKVT